MLIAGVESEKDSEIEGLRERNRQLALTLRDSQGDLEGAERRNAVQMDKLREASDALSHATDELNDLRRKTREREAYIRQLQVGYCRGGHSFKFIYYPIRCAGKCTKQRKAKLSARFALG